MRGCIPYGVVRAAGKESHERFALESRLLRDARASLVTSADISRTREAKGATLGGAKGAIFGTPRGERAVASPSCTSSVGVDARRAREAAVGRGIGSRARTRSVVLVPPRRAPAMSNDTSASRPSPSPRGATRAFPSPAPYPPAPELHAGMSPVQIREPGRGVHTRANNPCVCAGMWIPLLLLLRRRDARRVRGGRLRRRASLAQASLAGGVDRGAVRGDRGGRRPLLRACPGTAARREKALPEGAPARQLLALGGAAPDIFTQAAIAKSATPDARLAISESVGAGPSSPPRARRWPSSSGSSAPRRTRASDCRATARAAARENHRLTSWRWTRASRDAMAYGGLIAVTAPRASRTGRLRVRGARVRRRPPRLGPVLRDAFVWRRRRAVLTVGRADATRSRVEVARASSARGGTWR